MVEQLATVLLSLIGSNFGLTVRRLKRNGSLYAIAVVFALTAYIALIEGVFLLLAERYDAIVAVFAVAIGAIGSAAAVLVGVVLANKADRQRARPPTVGRGLLAIGAASALPLILKSRTLTGLATLGVIALLASRMPPDQSDDSAL
jgi:uncharacterized membrane protein